MSHAFFCVKRVYKICTITYSLTQINAATDETPLYRLAIDGIGEMHAYGKYTDVPWNAYREQIVEATIGDGVTSVSFWAFAGCNDAVFSMESGVYYIDKWAIKSTDHLSTFALREDTVGIAERAFVGNSELREITIPHHVKYIGAHAFEGDIQSITMGSGVVSIGRNAFYSECMEGVYITDLSAWCQIEFANETDGFGIIQSGANPLAYARNLYLNGQLVTDLTIPADVPHVSAIAFSGCESLTSVTISDGVLGGIGAGAFLNCSNLVSVTIGNGVTAIGDNAFKACEALSHMTIGNSVTSIGEKAFWSCKALETVTIPDSVRALETMRSSSAHIFWM